MQSKYLAFIAAIAIGFTGCADRQPNTGISQVDGKCVVAGSVAPTWICAPEDNKEFYTNYGTSKISDAGFDFARTNATANAKASLALQIGTKVDVLVKRFMQTTGVGDSSIASVKSQNTNQIAEVTISNSKQIELWQSPNTKELYVLIGVSKKTVLDHIAAEVGKNSDSWQSFLAKERDRDMKDAIKEAKK